MPKSATVASGRRRAAEAGARPRHRSRRLRRTRCRCRRRGCASQQLDLVEAVVVIAAVPVVQLGRGVVVDRDGEECRAVDVLRGSPRPSRGGRRTGGPARRSVASGRAGGPSLPIERPRAATISPRDDVARGAVHPRERLVREALRAIDDLRGARVGRSRLALLLVGQRPRAEQQAARRSRVASHMSPALSGRELRMVVEDERRGAARRRSCRAGRRAPDTSARSCTRRRPSRPTPAGRSWTAPRRRRRRATRCVDANAPAIA